MEDLTSLARAAAAGDAPALSEFVRVAYPQVWSLASRLVDEQSADDLAQEALVRIVRALPRYRSQSTARTWFLAITRNACMDELRSRHRRRQREAQAAAQPSMGVAPDASGQVEVADLLARLDLDRREAFVLTQILDLSYQEAAEVCGCPLGTIRSRVARARDDLIRLHRQLDQSAQSHTGEGSATPRGSG